MRGEIKPACTEKATKTHDPCTVRPGPELPRLCKLLYSKPSRSFRRRRDACGLGRAVEPPRVRHIAPRQQTAQQARNAIRARTSATATQQSTRQLSVRYPIESTFIHLRSELCRCGIRPMEQAQQLGILAPRVRHVEK